MACINAPGHGMEALIDGREVATQGVGANSTAQGPNSIAQGSEVVMNSVAPATLQDDMLVDTGYTCVQELSRSVSSSEVQSLSGTDFVAGTLEIHRQAHESLLKVLV